MNCGVLPRTSDKVVPPKVCAGTLSEWKSQEWVEDLGVRVTAT